MLANHYNLLGEYGDFKRRKIRICTNSLEILMIFLENFQKVPLIMFLGAFFKAKWKTFVTIGMIAV